MKTSKIVIASGVMLAFASPAAATLLVNGGFEASSSPTTTPPGWFNIGHMDGVISYAAFSTPAYEGLNYYDIGGFGAPTPTIGDGIAQTVATANGSNYVLTFGYSGENTAGVTTVLDVKIGSQLSQFTIVGDSSGIFKKPFTTVSLNYLATGLFTTIAFTISSSSQVGFNDPLVDGVSFALAGPGVPEPASWALMITGFGLVGAAMRRRETALA